MRLVDIAKKANVSLGTVDRVVNGRGKVAPETEKIVRDIINEFGYVPNLRARSLSSKKKINFAVLVPKPQGEDYWHKILSGIQTAENAIKEFGINVSEFLYDQDDDILFAELANQILATRFEGVVLAPLFIKEAKSFVTRLEKENIPYVFIDSSIEKTHPLCSVCLNDFQSGVLAAKLLNYSLYIDDEILAISNLKYAEHFELIQDRSNGFKSFFETKINSERIIHSFEIINPKYEKLAGMLEEKLIQFPKIKGIFIDNSKAHWVARYLDENNILNMKLVGFDLIEQNIRYLQNGTIEFILFDHAENQGEMGIQILFDHVLKKKETPQLINMPINLVTKENLQGFL